MLLFKGRYCCDRTDQQGRPKVFSLGLQQLDFDIVYFGAWLAAKGFGGIFELSAENSLTVFKVVMNYNVRE